MALILSVSPITWGGLARKITDDVASNIRSRRGAQYLIRGRSGIRRQIPAIILYILDAARAYARRDTKNETASPIWAESPPLTPPSRRPYVANTAPRAAIRNSFHPRRNRKKTFTSNAQTASLLVARVATGAKLIPV